jgi:predicted metal-dependent RNase
MHLKFCGAARQVTGSSFVFEMDSCNVCRQTGLVNWLRHFQPIPRRLFLVHGEEATAEGLAVRIELKTGCRANIPQHGESVEL